MRNKLISALLVTTVACTMFSGCGSKQSSESGDPTAASTASSGIEEDAEWGDEEESGADVEVSKFEASIDKAEIVDDPLLTSNDCISMPEWKGIKLTKYVSTVTEQDVKNYIYADESTSIVEDKNATLQEGDVANLDYIGSENGVVFDGGAATDAEVLIGRDSIVQGLDDYLIGMKAGEVRDIDLETLDHDSEDEDTNTVSFHVTLNNIQRFPELTDEWVSEKTDGKYTSAEEYIDYVTNLLREQNSEDASYALTDEAMTAIMKETTVNKLPKAMYDEVYAEVCKSADSSLKEDGYDSVDAYLEEYNMTQKEFDAENVTYAKGLTAQKLVLSSLAAEMGIDPDGQEYQDLLKETAKGYGLSVDDFIESYGETSVFNHIMQTLTMEKVIEQADITEEEI